MSKHDRTLPGRLPDGSYDIVDELSDVATSEAAGVLFKTKTHMLLMKRRDTGEWSIPAGNLEKNETPLHGAQREAAEETGYPGDHRAYRAHTGVTRGVKFHTFVQPAEWQFSPILNPEHTQHGWYTPKKLPKPLHPGLVATLHAMSEGGGAVPLTRDYNEEHQPAGSPGGIGGQFAPKGTGGGAETAPTSSAAVSEQIAAAVSRVKSAAQVLRGAGFEVTENNLVRKFSETVTSAEDYPEHAAAIREYWEARGAVAALQSKYGALVTAPPSKVGEPISLDPAVVQVGGDAWNQATAVRLEREYQQVKPVLEKLATDAVEAAPEEEPPEEEEDQPYTPEAWDEIGNAQQEEIKNDWMEKTKHEFLESEQQNWYDSGEAMDQTKYNLADKGPDEQYVMDALNELREERANNREAEIPFDNNQLIDAMSFDEFKTGYGGDKDVEISWNDDKLVNPKGLDTDPLLPLPGVEPFKPADKLTQEMRDAIEKKIVNAFNKEADDNVDKAEPPDYLSESVEEYQDQYWDSKSDKEKFSWAEDNGHIEKVDEPAKPELTTLTRLPVKFDPLSESGSDMDYKLTKLLANHMSAERVADVMVERKIFDSRGQALRATRNLDNRLWTAWKNDSASTDGLILQAATAAELGGRFREVEKIARMADLKVDADNRFESSGGWEGIRAYVRGKWETTQYLLDKASTPEVDLYRGMLMKDRGTEEPVEVKDPDFELPFHYTKLPELDLKRNGAQSTTADLRVANKWKGVGALAKGYNPEEDRVVFRMRVPRTAVLSVPAYGQNLEGEREVVLAGTAWKKWDAWHRKAPLFETAPL